MTWVKSDRGKRGGRKEISQVPQPTIGESD